MGTQTQWIKIRRKMSKHRRILIVALTLILLLVYFFHPRLYDPSSFDLFRIKAVEVDLKINHSSDYTNQYTLSELLRFYNKLGQRGSNLTSLHVWLIRETPSFRKKILSALDLEYMLSSFEGNVKKISRKLKAFPRETEVMSRGVGQLNLVVVSCEDRRPEALAMIRSALLMSQDAKLNIIAFVDYSSMEEFGSAILKLKWDANRVGLDFRFELRKTWFPVYGEWRGLYRPCATQRLFLPRLLPGYDSILYVDSDTLFLSNVTEYWDFFSKMDARQFATMTANDEIPGNGFYNLHSKVPYFGPRGLNAGIILMNLTRMREFDFEDKCLRIYEEYGNRIDLADQDILNIFFNQHPELLLEISCAFNFRTSHCDCEHNDHVGHDCKCKAAMKNGVSVVHGNQEYFHKSTYPFFVNMFNAFNDLNFTHTSLSTFVDKLQIEYDEENEVVNPCFNLTVDMLYGKFQNYMGEMENRTIIL